MRSIYLVVLALCTLAILALLGVRLLTLRREPHPGWTRLLNESVWTLIPLLVMAALWIRLG